VFRLRPAVVLSTAGHPEFRVQYVEGEQ
jgi:hypothetical protein